MVLEGKSITSENLSLVLFELEKFCGAEKENTMSKLTGSELRTIDKYLAFHFRLFQYSLDVHPLVRTHLIGKATWEHLLKTLSKDDMQSLCKSISISKKRQGNAKQLLYEVFTYFRDEITKMRENLLKKLFASWFGSFKASLSMTTGLANEENLRNYKYNALAPYYEKMKINAI